MAHTPTADGRVLRRVAAAVTLGTTIEWYDFMLYGLASATVFGPLFFPNADPLAGLLLSFSTFAVGFAARPIGGVVFGHFGDRLGRKRTLVVSLILMGTATTLIGVLPTYGAIGVAAPLLLVFLRIVQGFAVGGEWAGAVSSAVEYAPVNKRSYWGSLPQVGLPLGIILSNLVFLAVSAAPGELAHSLAWRIPFLLSAILVLVGLYARFSLEETPVFKAMENSGDKARVPALAAMRTYPKVIVLMIFAIMGSGVYFYGITTFSVAYATDSGSLAEPQIFTALMIGAASMAVALPFMGRLAQRGRHPMVKWTTLGLGPWIFAMFAAVDSGSMAIVVLAFIAHGVFYAVLYAALATFIVERFPPEIRYSVSAATYNLGGLLGGSLAPFFSAALVGFTGTIWSVCIYSALFSIVGFIAAHLLGPGPVHKETASLSTVSGREPDVAET